MGATAGGAAAGSTAAVGAAVIQALKASGVIVSVAPDEFRKVLYMLDNPIVVTATTSFFGTSYQYLTSYRGLAFYTKSKEPIELGMAEVIAARKIWVPG
ncbi:MAG: hypothetical protein GXP47_09640 [Acidobacteria bacterium]|nr:hypothetical protein [Acidobacteriota bacterium]